MRNRNHVGIFAVALIITACDSGGYRDPTRVPDIFNGPTREESSTHWATSEGTFAFYEDGSGLDGILEDFLTPFIWVSTASGDMIIFPIGLRPWALIQIEGGVEDGRFTGKDSTRKLFDFVLVPGEL